MAEVSSTQKQKGQQLQKDTSGKEVPLSQQKGQRQHFDNVGAIIREKGGQFVVDNVPPHKLGRDEILIENHACALNPVDWKLRDGQFPIKNYPVILGFDVAGIVREVGDDVKRFKIGDRVLSYLPNILAREGLAYGGFQKYSVGTELGTCKFPTSMPFESAATIPLALTTAAYGLFDYCLGLDKPQMLESTTQQQQTTTGTGGTRMNKDQIILIWGGASSVGLFAIQLAKHAGYRVITTCSPDHFNYLKELGAEETFDYHENEIVDTIKRYIKDKSIYAAFDAVCTDLSTIRCVSLLQLNGGKLAVTLPDSIPKDKVPDNVRIMQIWAAEAFTRDDGRLARWLFHDYLERALENKMIRPNNVKVFSGGLNALQKMFDYGKKGNICAEKCILFPQEAGKGP